MSRCALKPVLGLLCLAATLSAIGCGGGGSTKLRVLQASPNEPNIDVLVDATSISSNLAFEANTGYQTVNSGSRQFVMEASGTTTNIVPSSYQTLSLSGSTQNTFVLMGYSSSLSGILLTDDTTAPTNSGINLRIVNAAPTIAGADIYVVASGTSLGGTPTVSGLSFGAASSYQSLAAGTYQLYFTEPGTLLQYYNTPAMTFTSGQNRTIVLVSPPGGFTTLTLADLD
jgi:hypothetical protein